MGAIRSYRDLMVWQQGMELVVSTYRVARDLPGFELFGLGAQMRRAAVSVPANIAEGHGRSGTQEYLHHLSIAYGSLLELETHLEIAERLYLEPAEIEPVLSAAEELGARLLTLISRLKAKQRV